LQAAAPTANGQSGAARRLRAAEAEGQTLRADPQLVAKWICGWALSREKLAPEAIEGGWRVQVNEPDQIARYVFARADEHVRACASRATAPLTPIKVCAASAEVAPLLPDPWIVERTAPMMTKAIAQASNEGRAQDGYSVVLTGAGSVLMALAVTRAGDVVAGGRVAVVDDIAVFDQILTHEDHRRRGLGGAVMRTLENGAAQRGARRGMLVATDAGCALYLTLGWQVYAPYTTAIVPSA
jgi:GNAT superfamily N-acetyltransferase